MIRVPHSWRTINLAAFIGWIGLLPIAYTLGWIYSVAFISLVSIYANAVGHLAAWRADT